ncbi:MAG: FHA domain-containing protein [Planctomycetaceae bacterium]|nr:FHA domain-containing protein [Planctomycetaceae bacterium]
MSVITLRVVDGPERGKTFYQLNTPVTVGREEGNLVQLNDERISRYHMKIHENDGTVLLTDLQSTNGTRVNGETVQLWILRPGDLITIGRSAILVGTAAEIGTRLAKIRESDQGVVVPMGCQSDDFPILESVFRPNQTYPTDELSHSWESELYRGISADDIAALHILSPPNIPTNLPPKQTAELAEFLQYIHLRLRYLVGSVEQDKVSGKEVDTLRVSLEAHQWQNLLDLYGRLAIYLQSITEPKS